MEILDTHNHFWKYDPGEYPWITDDFSVLQRDFLPADLQAEMEKNGVKGSIAVQARQTQEETRFLLELAAQNPFIKGVVGWLDLRSPRFEVDLQQFLKFPALKGLRHILQDEPDDQFMLKKDFLQGISLLKEYDLIYEILIYEKQLPATLKFMERCPDQRLVLDHLAKPPIKSGKIANWKWHIEELAQNKNLYAKLSGLVTEADLQNWKEEDIRPYLDVAFETFGPDRLMYGSDWPVCLLAADYSRVINLLKSYVGQLTNQEQQQVMVLNAKQFYQL